MEQDVEEHISTVCSCCLSRDRNLMSINNMPLVYEIFKVLMTDFNEDIIDIVSIFYIIIIIVTCTI